MDTTILLVLVGALVALTFLVGALSCLMSHLGGELRVYLGTHL